MEKQSEPNYLAKDAFGIAKACIRSSEVLGERKCGKMKKQNGSSRAESGSVRLKISLIAGIGSLFMLFFAACSKVEIIQFFGSFWTTILVVMWISLILPHRTKS